MIGIGNIKVNGEGKSKEEIKKEIMDQMSDQLEKIFEAKEKEEVKTAEEEPEGVYIHLKADQSKDGSGFTVAVNFNGEYGDVLTMLTVALAEALHNIANDEEDEYDSDLILDFIPALIAEYKNKALSQCKLKKEEK